MFSFFANIFGYLLNFIYSGYKNCNVTTFNKTAKNVKKEFKIAGKNESFAI